MEFETVALGHVEAHELCTAMTATLAEALGVRVLVVKGAALERHGLRGPRVSADVDVLVEPPGFEDFCAALGRGGWHPREEIFVTRQTIQHSRTYWRDGWPNDIDVHAFMPGFLATPDEVFDVFWASREAMEFAHTVCQVPNKPASLLIWASHSVRGADREARHARELEDLVSIPLSDSERRSIEQMALDTGSAATLGTVLGRMDILVEPSAAELGSDALREWRMRVESGSQGAYFWILAVRRSQWWKAPLVLYRAFWPTRHDLLVALPHTPDTVRGRLRSRYSRLIRGLRTLPRSLRALATRAR